MNEVVPAALAGERLDRVVAFLTGCSRAEASALVAEGEVEVNGEAVVVRSHRLAEGDVVAVDWQPTEVRAEPDPGVAVPVVHADDDVIVVDKPAGLVVHPGAGNATGTLVQGLLARYPEIAGVGEPARPGIVHRLDKETSGLLVVARSSSAYESLVTQLGARTVTRTYTSLVWGHVEHAAGEVDAPIGRSARQPTKMAVSERGRAAITRYRRERTFADPVEVTLLECRLETGRTHQIRVHLRAIGHPVVGDERYQGVRSSLVVPRLFLHAAHLGFTHPGTGEAVAFASALPADLQSVLDGLR